MIGWRVGWIVGPPSVFSRLSLVSISNVVCPVRIAEDAAALALRSESDLAATVAELQRRRDVMLQELDGLPVVKPQGGWSMLVDVSRLGMTGVEASRRLLDQGKIATTPMMGWGSERSDNFVRFVFSNELVLRLSGMGERVRKALRPH